MVVLQRSLFSVLLEPFSVTSAAFSVSFRPLNLMIIHVPSQIYSAEILGRMKKIKFESFCCGKIGRDSFVNALAIALIIGGAAAAISIFGSS